jgi:hypothetical protein
MDINPNSETPQTWEGWLTQAQLVQFRMGLNCHGSTPLESSPEKRFAEMPFPQQTTVEGAD